MSKYKKTHLNLSIIIFLVACLFLVAASSLQSNTVQAQDWNILTVHSVGNGSVNIDPIKEYYSVGEIVSLTALPSTGWSFSSWTGDGTGTGTTQTLIITGNMDVTATFIQNIYSVFVTVLPSSSAGTVTGYVTTQLIIMVML